MPHENEVLETDPLGAHITINDDGTFNVHFETNLSGELPDEVTPNARYIGDREDSIVFEFPRPDDVEDDSFIKHSTTGYEDQFEAIQSFRRLLGDYSVVYMGELLHATMAVEEHNNTDALEDVLEKLYDSDEFEYEVTITSTRKAKEDDE